MIPGRATGGQEAQCAYTPFVHFWMHPCFLFPRLSTYTETVGFVAEGNLAAVEDLPARFVSLAFELDSDAELLALVLYV